MKYSCKLQDKTILMKQKYDFATLNHQVYCLSVGITLIHTTNFNKVYALK